MSTILFLLLLAPSVPGEPSEAIFARFPKAFDCAPKMLRPGSILTLSKRDASIDELAVITPGGKRGYFLIVGLPPPEMRSLMSDKQFARTRKLSINASSLQGMRWVNTAQSERVFTEPGRYEFHASSALESEEGGYSCVVEYKP